MANEIELYIGSLNLSPYVQAHRYSWGHLEIVTYCVPRSLVDSLKLLDRRGGLGFFFGAEGVFDTRLASNLAVRVNPSRFGDTVEVIMQFPLQPSARIKLHDIGGTFHD